MGEVRSCAQLRDEHAVIRDVLASMGRLTRQRRDGKPVPAASIAAAVDFFSAFVGGCHNPKEETLFPLVDVAGLPAGLLDHLRDEHAEEHRLLGELRPLSSRHHVDAAAWGVLETYAALLGRHIGSEEDSILPLAERQLSPQQDAALTRAFARIERRAVGPGGRDVLIALADAVVLASRTIASAPAILARDVMSPRTATVAPDEPLARAASLMEALGTRQLGVVAAGRLVGVLSRTDMEAHRGHFEWTAVRAAMSAQPHTVAPDTTIHAVARLLVEHGFNAVPVVDGDQFLGMISRRDALRALTAGD
jgi:CBS domain-containing protein